MNDLHSAGPWSLAFPYDELCWLQNSDLEPIAYVRQGNASDQVFRANAYLLRAAPELIAAARKALDECADLIETDAGRALQSAIDRATKPLEMRAELEKTGFVDLPDSAG